MVEILSAALQGGSFLKMLTGFKDGKKVPYCLGHFFIAIDVSAFTELDEFKKTTGDILRNHEILKRLKAKTDIQQVKRNMIHGLTERIKEYQ